MHLNASIVSLAGPCPRRAPKSVAAAPRRTHVDVSQRGDGSAAAADASSAPWPPVAHVCARELARERLVVGWMRVLLSGNSAGSPSTRWLPIRAARPSFSAWFPSHGHNVAKGPGRVAAVVPRATSRCAGNNGEYWPGSIACRYPCLPPARRLPSAGGVLGTTCLLSPLPADSQSTRSAASSDAYGARVEVLNLKILVFNWRRAGPRRGRMPR